MTQPLNDDQDLTAVTPVRPSAGGRSWQDRAQQYQEQHLPSSPTGMTELAPDEGQTVSGTSWVDRARQWYTGGNTSSTANGWDNDFWDRMQSSQDRAITETGGLGRFFERPDATGVVTYQHTSEDGRKTFDYGDVYDRGQKVGNIFTTYQDKATANAFMAQFVFGADAGLLFEQEQRNPGAIAAALEEERAKTEREAEGWLTQLDYQEAVAEEAQGYQENQGGLGAVLAGAAGGGALGFGLGTVVPGIGNVVGTIGGAIIGGVSAWLNRDEIIEQAARAKVLQDMAGEQFGDTAGFTQGLQSWSEVAGKAINPLQNIHHGLYDVLADDSGTGDAEVAFNRVDPETGERERSGASLVLDMAAGVGDAFLQFASPIGQAAYMAQMSGTILGKATTPFTAGGMAFNPASGTYESWLRDQEGDIDPGRIMSGIVDIGIDVVQLGMARGIAQKYNTVRNTTEARIAQAGGTATVPGVTAAAGTREARRQAAARAQALGLEAPTLRLVDRLARVQLDDAAVGFTRAAGMRVQVDAAGRAIQGTMRPTVAILAPSEMISTVSASRLARQAALNASPGGPASAVVRADDFLRAADALARGERRLTAALVNAFGEGTEEAIQAVTGATMFGLTPDPHEIAESAAMGAAMGFGMTLGASSRGKTNAEQMFSLGYAYTAMMRPPGKVPSEAEFRKTWDAMTEVERRSLAQQGSVMDQLGRDAARAIETQLSKTSSASQAEVAHFRRLAFLQEQAETGKLNEKLDESFQITQHADPNTPQLAAAMSLQKLVYVASQWEQGLALTVETYADTGAEDAQEVIAEAQLTAEYVKQFRALLQTTVERYQAGKTRGERRRVLNELNNVISEWFTREQPPNTKLTDEQLLARAKAVSMLPVRYPAQTAGSFPMLHFWVDEDMTHHGVTNGLAISHAFLAQVGGDFDGDTFVNQNYVLAVLPSGKYVDLRTGMGRLGSGATAGTHGAPSGTIVAQDTYEYQPVWTQQLAEFLQPGHDNRVALANDTLTRIRRTVERRYKGKLPNKAVRELVTRLMSDLRHGDASALQTFQESLVTKVPSQLAAMQREGLTDEVTWISETITRELWRFQRAATAWYTPEPTPPTGDALEEPTRGDVTKPVRQASAATLVAQMRLLDEGDDVFRMMQHVFVSNYTSPFLVADAVEDDRNQFAAMIRFYTELTSSVTRSALDEMEADNSIVARAQLMARELVRAQYGKAGLPLGPALVRVLSTKGWDLKDEVGPDGKLTGRVSLVQGSIAQLLLRRARIVEMREMERVSTETDEARWSRFQRLESAGNEAEALLEVLGGVSEYELFGDNSTLRGGTRSVMQRLKQLRGLSLDQRTRAKAAAKSDPEYAGRSESSNPPYNISDDVTPYRIYVDALFAVAQRDISMDDTGLTIGRLGSHDGRSTHGLAGQSYMQIEKLRESFDAIRTILHERGLLFKKKNVTGAQVKEILQKDPALHSVVLGLITRAEANSVYLQGGAVMKDWFYDLFTMDTETAVFRYWVNTMLESWNALGGRTMTQLEGDEAVRAYSTLTDRWHQQLFQMAADPNPLRLRRFIDKIATTNSILEFERWYNREMLREEAPLPVFASDVAEFSPDFMGNGFTVASPSADRREAITKLHQRLKGALPLADEAEQERAADEQFLKDAIAGYAARTKAEKKGSQAEVNKALAAKAARMDEIASGLFAGIPGIAASFAFPLMVDMGVAINANIHTKGTAVEVLDVASQAKMLEQVFGFTTGLVAHENELHTHAVQELVRNLPLLARRGARTMTDRGVPVEFDPPSGLELAKLLLERPDLRTTLTAMYTRGNWGITKDGAPVLQHAHGGSFAALAERGPFGELFHANIDGYVSYVTEMDTLTRTEDESFMASKFVIQLAVARMYAAGRVLSRSEISTIFADAYRDVATTLQYGAELGNTSTKALTELVPQVQKWLKENEVGSPLRDISKEDREVLVMGFKDQFRVETERIVAEMAQVGPSSPEWAALKEQLDDLNESLDNFVNTPNFEALQMQYWVGAKDTKNTRSIRRRKANLVARIGSDANRGFRNLLFTQAPFAQEAIKALNHALATGLTEGKSNIPQLSKTPSKNAELWNALSHAVIGSFYHTYHDEGTGINPIPRMSDNKAEHRLYDPSFAYLTDFLLPDHPVMKAAIKLHGLAQRGTEKEASTEGLLEKLQATIYREKTLPVWHEDIKVHTWQSLKELTTAGSLQGTQAAGLLPEETWAVATTAATTWDLPSPAAASTVELTWDQLDVVPDESVDFMFTAPSGQQYASKMPHAMLWGRFIPPNGLTVTYTDPISKQTVQLQDPLRGFPELVRTEAASGQIDWTTTSPNRLASGLHLRLPAGVDRSTVRIQMQFLHPDSRPAEPADLTVNGAVSWLHNGFFDGTVSDLDSVMTPARGVAVKVGADANQTTGVNASLQSNKRGAAPFRITPYPDVSEKDHRKQIELGWQTDFRAMIERKALYSLLRDTGFGKTHPLRYADMRKMEMLRTFVRGFLVDQDGNETPVLWSAFKVLAWQAENPGAPFPLARAELWLPTTAQLRTAMGDEGPSSANLPFTEERVLTASAMRQWNNVEERILQKFPGALELTADGKSFTHEELWDLPEFSGLSLARARKVMVQDDRERDKRSNEYMVRQALADEGRTVRALGRTTTQIGLAEDTYKSLLSEVQRPSALGIDLTNGYRLPFFTKSTFYNFAHTVRVATDLLNRTKLDRFGAAFTVVAAPLADKGGVANGVLTPINFDPSVKGYQAPDKAYRLYPGDLVFLDAGSFVQKHKGDENAAYLDAARAISALQNRYVTIILLTGEDGLTLRNELSTLLRSEPKYVSVGTSSQVFAPRQEEDAAQDTATEFARKSTLGYVEPPDVTDNQMISLVIEGGTAPPSTESATWFVNEAERPTMRGKVIIPTQALNNFNLPRSPEDVEIAKAAITQLLQSDLKIAHLMEIGGYKPSQRKAFERQLRKMVDGWTPGSVIPEKLAHGDFLPLIGERLPGRGRQVLLYRLGHEQPTDVKAQLEAPYDGNKGGLNMAVFPPKVQANHTVPPGGYVSNIRDSRNGIEANVTSSMTSMLHKFVETLTGIKLVSGPVSNTLGLAGREIIPGRLLNLVTSRGSEYDKAGYGRVISGFREAFHFFGFSAMPYLVETFYGLDYRSMSTEDKKAYVQKVRDILYAVQKAVTKYDNGEVFAAMKATNVLEAYAENWDRIIAALPGVVSAAVPRPDAVISGVLGSNLTPAQEMTRLILLYLMTDTAKVEHVLIVNGFDSRGRPLGQHTSHRIPPMVGLALDGSSNQALRTELMDEIRRKLAKGVTLRDDWTVVVEGEQSPYEKKHGKATRPVYVGQLKVTALDALDHAGELLRVSAARQSKQKYSQNAAAVIRETLGVDVLATKSLVKTNRFIANTGVERFETEGGLWRMLYDIPKGSTPVGPWSQETVGEREYRRVAWDSVGFYRKGIDRSTWDLSKQDWQDAANAYDSLAHRLLNAYNLDARHRPLVDFWVRQYLGKPKGTPEVEVSPFRAMDAVKLMLENAERGLLPLTGSTHVPRLHHLDLEKIYEANRDNPVFRLRIDPVRDEAGYANSWDDWVLVALAAGDSGLNNIDRMYQVENDGMLHSYQDAITSTFGLPVSDNDEITKVLVNPETSRFVASLDLGTATLLASEGLNALQAGSGVEIKSELRTSHGILSRNNASSVETKRAEENTAWRKEKGVREPNVTAIHGYRTFGAGYYYKGSTAIPLVRMAGLLRLGTALIDPRLFLSSGPEYANRMFQLDIANILMGLSTSRAGRMVAGAVETATGGRIRGSQYTKEDEQQFALVARALAGSELKTSLLGEMFSRPRQGHESALEHGMNRVVRWGGQMQEFRRGLLDAPMMRTYLETVVAEFNRLPTWPGHVVTTRSLLDALQKDPMYVAKNYTDIHNRAKAAIANTRSIKRGPIDMFIGGIVDPLSSHPNAFINTFSNLFLKYPLAFRTFAFNVGTNLLGLQGPMALLSMHFDGRSKNAIIRRAQAAMRGEIYDPSKAETFDLSDAIESIDLAKQFIQSGITWTGLFSIGMALGGLGITGEDEEDRRRRRAARFSGAGYVYDPRKLQNDWRNRDAIFLDWLPAGLSGFFRANPDEPAMANMNWMLRQFFSPLIGMARFFETGNPQEVVRGFEDALGAFPLINNTMWSSAVASYNTLMDAAADNAGRGRPEDMTQAHLLMTTAVRTLENMYFESSFANAIYVAMDEYDRDPWVIPMTENGEIQRDGEGLPIPTNMLESFRDEETGEVRQGYQNRDWQEAASYSLSETRLSHAIFQSLFTGFSESPHFRQNMAVKEREIKLTELDQDVAEDMILSMYDAQQGGEVLTLAGSEAVIRGLWKGSVSLDSPALEGIYITQETRRQIETKWRDALVIEGMEKYGMTYAEAEDYMNNIWFGPYEDVNDTGLRGILYSDQIPSRATARYHQLNTTYVIGPDGLPWATGIKRNNLLSAFGLAPLERYFNPDDTNLTMDARGNMVDDVYGINTGLRGLKRIPEEPEPYEPYEPTSTEHLNDYVSDWYGGGGGGGSRSPFRLNPPERSNAPYVDSVPNVFAQNPYIRRANIRRERFFSDRGRLKSWQ